MTKKNEPSSSDLRRGRAAAENDLQQAREEYARAAYAHAADRQDPVAREAVIAVKRKIDLYQAEIQGFDAATDEARRREAAAARKEDMKRRAQRFDDGQAAAAEMEGLITQADLAMAKAGNLRQRILDLADAARRALIDGVTGAGRVPDSIPLIEGGLENCWNAMLQHHGVIPYEIFTIRDSEAKGASDSLRHELARFQTLSALKRGDVLANEQAAA